MDNMKKKIISAVLAATIVITSAMPAFATPNQEVIENQKKYDELTQKIEDINNQIYTLNGEIEPLVQTIESNNAQMEQIKVEVENTEKEIETAKDEIAKTEEVLGKRIRELYKSGGQSSYIMLLFSADSFNDLIIPAINFVFGSVIAEKSFTTIICSSLAESADLRANFLAFCGILIS